MVLDPKQLTRFNPGRGVIGGYRFAVWDFVGKCQGDDCILHKVCTYKDGKVGGKDPRAKKCSVERYYMGVVFKPFSELIEKTKDPFLMQWVGLHIIPLYHQLIKLKKIERSLDSPMDTTIKGDVRAHPVLGEIRKVIAAIRAEWKSSGLMEIARDEGYMGASLPAPLDDIEDIEGDSDYHDSLYTDTEEEDEE